VFANKKMFKVVSPMERRDGGTWWMRCGSAYLNKDNSINVYIEALPLGQKEGVKLQLRELTEEDLRERADKRGSYQARGTLGASALPPPSDASLGLDNTPF
jgi:hypothetical protein